jgi:predicted phosphoribosyltransferase
MNEEDIVYRLRKRAEIRRQITTRKSVQEGQPDRIADLLEEAANRIENERSRKYMTTKEFILVTIGFVLGVTLVFGISKIHFDNLQHVACKMYKEVNKPEFSYVNKQFLCDNEVVK